MRNLLLLVLLVTACDQPTAPVTLGPECSHAMTFPIAGSTQTATLKAYYSDCTKQNLDSLRAAGWTVEWDRH